MNDTLFQSLNTIGKNAKMASQRLSRTSPIHIGDVLAQIADMLMDQMDTVIQANDKDIENARTKGLSDQMIDRLTLTPERIQNLAIAVRSLIQLKSPIGDIKMAWEQPNGLKIAERLVPLGVVGMIYEARPNVTVDAACLCLKTCNAVILRGGSEAIESNKMLVALMQQALENQGLPRHSVQLIENTDRAVAHAFMGLREYVDVLIPRGGAGLIKSVVEHAKIPVIETGVGNCHLFIDASADPHMAGSIVMNAKTSRTSVCNAAESLLIHQDYPRQLTVDLLCALHEAGVELRGCEKSQALHPSVVGAIESDYGAEFLDMILSVKIVPSLQAAIDHIEQYGTKHSEAIITSSYENAMFFTDQVDAAAVYVNASTRFTDGGEFGFGAEIGISTQKLHARGPMGLVALTTSKYVVFGNGQIRK